METGRIRAGRVRRLDHVKVSTDALTAVTRTDVDQEGTLVIQEREDHRLVSVSSQWSLQRRAAFLQLCLWCRLCRLREAAASRCSGGYRAAAAGDAAHCPPFGLRDNEDVLREEEGRSLRRRARSWVQPQGMIGVGSQYSLADLPCARRMPALSK